MEALKNLAQLWLAFNTLLAIMALTNFFCSKEYR